MSFAWYVLHTQSQKEPIVAERLQTQGVTIFFPQLKIKPVNPRARTLRPFFPGYLFVYVDLDQIGISGFQYLPNAIGLVRFGEQPAVVETALIEAIAEQIDQINQIGGELLHKLQSGDHVLIEHGPFAGYEAIFDRRLRDSDRVRLLLDLIGNRQMAIEIESNRIRALR